MSSTPTTKPRLWARSRAMPIAAPPLPPSAVASETLPRSTSSRRLPTSMPSISAAPTRFTTSRPLPASPAASTSSSRSPSAPPRRRRWRSSAPLRPQASWPLRPCVRSTTPPSTPSRTPWARSPPSVAPRCALVNIPRATTKSSRGTPPISSTATWPRAPSWTSVSTPSSPWSRFSACPPASPA